MNYDAFMEPVTWFLTGVSKHSTEKREDMYNNADVFWGTMSYPIMTIPAFSRAPIAKSAEWKQRAVPRRMQMWKKQCCGKLFCCK